MWISSKTESFSFNLKGAFVSISDVTSASNNLVIKAEVMQFSSVWWINAEKKSEIPVRVNNPKQTIASVSCISVGYNLKYVYPINSKFKILWGVEWGKIKRIYTTL